MGEEVREARGSVCCWLVGFSLCSFLLVCLISGFFDRAGARPGWFGPLPRGAGMSNVPTCVGGVIPIYFERAVKPSFPRRREPTPWPHIYGGITVTWYYLPATVSGVPQERAPVSSEAAVLHRPLSTIYAGPETYRSAAGCAKAIRFDPHPERGKARTVTDPDELASLSSKALQTRHVPAPSRRRADPEGLGLIFSPSYRG